MRIAGGRYRNRKLYVPEGQHVRPTSDRMRQTLFNLLTHAQWAIDFNLEKAHVLDLYCGSGALGLEALSRGAVHCTFVDRDIEPVKTNTGFLNKEEFQIVKGDATKISVAPQSVSLVFMDPPYFKGLIEPTVANLLGGGVLKAGAIVVIEAEKVLSLTLPLTRLDIRTQAQSNLHIFRYDPAV